MTTVPLSKEVYEAIRTGFSMSEMEVYAFDGSKKAMKKYLKNPAIEGYGEELVVVVNICSGGCLFF